MEEQNIIEEQQEKEKYVLNVAKLRRRLIITSASIILALSTMMLKQYHDFDVIFKGLYNLRYEEYILSSNIGSIGFIIAFLIAMLFTIFLWIYLYGKGTWQEKLNAKLLYDSFDIISIIPFFIAFVTLLNAFVISPASVTRTSMEPNYYEGDNVFILHTNNYDRFDVVIVLAEVGELNPETGLYSKNEHYIKRIIGLPGETITLSGGEIYIDGELLDDPTVLKTGAGTYCNVGILQNELEVCTFTVPEGEYFLIGDNREASYDSRRLGSFKIEDLFGVVILKIK
jgi:signal peptidase I